MPICTVYVIATSNTIVGDDYTLVEGKKKKKKEMGESFQLNLLIYSKTLPLSEFEITIYNNHILG